MGERPTPTTAIKKWHVYSLRLFKAPASAKNHRGRIGERLAKKDCGKRRVFSRSATFGGSPVTRGGRGKGRGHRRAKNTNKKNILKKLMDKSRG